MAVVVASTNRPPVETSVSARHVTVGPLPIFDGDLGTVTDWCIDRIRSGSGARIATANLDFVARARKDAALARDLASSHLVVADGAPVVWLSRITGAGKTRRTTGVDLVGALAEFAAQAGGIRAAFYGSIEETSAAAAATLESMGQGFTVVKRICPPFGPRSTEEVAADVSALVASQPQLMLVALGCPRQERFIAEHFDAIPGAIWIGIGGTFDFYAGKRVRAPRVFQASGLEWAIRLAQEPQRLWRRYIIDDIPALMAVAPGCLKRGFAHRRRGKAVKGDAIA